MSFIRLVTLADLDSLVELASESTFGLTTLRPDRDRLRKRIEESDTGEAPLLVMIDESDEKVIGTAGLFTHVGNSERAEPFYTYRLERTIHRSESLQVRNEVEALHLAKIFDGPTELGTLFLNPDYRGSGLGRILSLSRFLLIARESEKYDRQIIAEMRGIIDEQGRSPIWEALGRHFFQVDFPIADIMSSKDKKFIAELMPRHPIYVPLLPPQAQMAIGKVHPKTEPARQLLESEGFHFAKMVDIFDGGPLLRCDRKAIRTIVESTWCELTAIFDDRPSVAVDSLIATAEGAFRAIGSTTYRSSGGVALHRRDAGRLQIGIGDRLILSPLRGLAKDSWKTRPESSKDTL